MAQAHHRPELFRSRGLSDSGKVSFIELFFDLIFVFAVTQLSHSLLENFTWMGALHTAMLTMAVWWAWNYTTWVINWLSPDALPVRIMLFALMLVGLIMSTSIPEAFEHAGLYFGISYAAFQIGRTAFTVWALGHGAPVNQINLVRILCWLILSGVFWVAGGTQEDEIRLALWGVALLIDYVAPSLGFWVPRIGRSTAADWAVEGAHMAERAGLFIIIALGESIIVMGATFAGLERNAETVLAFLVSFLGTVSMWWIYFETTSRIGHHYIVNASVPGQLARAAYTYTHLLLAGGIVLSAVADEFLLAHPTGHLESGVALVILGSPALYLLSNAIFIWIVSRMFAVPHATGLAALAVLALFSHSLTPLALSASAVIVLIAVAVWGSRFSNRLCTLVPKHHHA
ncbi:low temperature requirement protein A [Cohnella sp. GCM10012308]|uniref:low temperature requirement protein A n=1 Tax=Cohnella sp. GCM10012308 TaxID=3317329 RepID=UPI003605AFAF